MYLCFLSYLSSSSSSSDSSHSLPKGYSINKIIGREFDKGTEERKTYIAPNRDRFLKKKIPSDLDAIINLGKKL